MQYKTGSSHTGKKGSITQRRYERIFLEDCPAEIYPESGFFSKLLRTKPENIGIQVIDISESGMRVVVSRKVPPDGKVRAVGRIPHFSEILEGIARIVWCSAQDDDHFLVGLDFVSVPDGHFSKIQHLRKAINTPEIRQKMQTRKRADDETRNKSAKSEDDGLVIMPPSNT